MPRAADAAAAQHASGDEEEAEPLVAGDSLDETATLPAEMGRSGFDVVPEGQHAVKASSEE